MSSSNPSAEAPPRQYDKFGFLIAANQESRIVDFEEPRSSRNRQRSPSFKEREPLEFSPLRKSREPKMDRHDKRDNRRRRYSPDLGDFSKDRGSKREPRRDFDHSDNWETPFTQPSFPPPTPAFSDSIAPSYPPPTYGHFNTVQYSGFSEMEGMEPSKDASAEAPAPPLQWTLQPPPTPLPAQDDHVKREAIASEMRNQRATLARQKEEYSKKATGLKRELDSLKQQRTELRGDSRRSPSPDSHRFLKENLKLQAEIQNKLKTIYNVIDMLNGILGDKSSEIDVGSSSDKSKHKSGTGGVTPSQSGNSSRDSSADKDKSSSRRKKRSSRSKSRSSGDKKFNYVYYDPEMHWCRLCNDFPATAKDYLNHLHTTHHHRVAAAHSEAPWHTQTNQHEAMPSYPGAPTKRTPIKGLQFFVPSTAWYCKLCDQWIGDLHCASAHLKSIIHSQNYANFVDLNPHWEMDWMSDRQKSFEKHRKTTAQPSAENVPQYAPHTISFQADGFHTKRKKLNSDSLGDENTIPLQINKKSKKSDKKRKKKNSSSESSDSSGSTSDSSPEKSKKNNKDPEAAYVPESIDQAGDDKLLAQWMSLQDEGLGDVDRSVLETLKNRVKSRAGEKVEQRVDGRVVSREREARELLAIRGERARLQHASKSFDREEKERRGNRDKERHKDKSYHGRDYEHSSSSQKASDSLEFKPYVKRDNHEQNETRFDKQLSEKSRKSSNNSYSNDSKKMPFIGKMPLFKSLSNKPAVKQGNESPKQGGSAQECIEVAKKKRDEINAQIQKSVAEFKEKLKSTLPRHEDGELPAPGLARPTALAGAHTGALHGHSEPPPKLTPSLTFPQTIHRIQKTSTMFIQAPATSAPAPPATLAPVLPPAPAVPAATAAHVKVQTKMTTSATTPAGEKKDSLHKDFQDALDIIFPSENAQKSEESKTNTTLPPGENAPNDTVMPPDTNIHLLSQIPPPGYQSMPPMMQYPQHPMAMMAAPPPMGMMMGYDYPGNMYGPPGLYDMSSSHYSTQPPKLSAAPKPQDMEDLAMLGIDAEDIGASGF